VWVRTYFLRAGEMLLHEISFEAGEYCSPGQGRERAWRARKLRADFDERGKRRSRRVSVEPRPAPPRLKHFEVNGQIFLGILADGFHQRPGFNQHLIGVFVEGFVLQQSAYCALARFQPVAQVG
jgi:hypothetical protein